MAKFIGLVGTGRGKAGNFVFSKGNDGTTIVRAYQPQVHNPKSLSQVQQRGKMNTAGRFSRLFTAANLSAFGGSLLSRRSRFNSNLLNNMRINSTDNSAYIIPELVKFSSGVTPTRCNYTSVPSEVTINMPANSGKRNVRVFVYFSPSKDSDIPAQALVADHAFDNSTSIQSFTIPLPWADDQPDPECNAYVWVCEWTPTTEGASQRYSHLIDLDGTEAISAQWEELLSNNGTWTDTTFLGTIFYSD